MQNIESIEREAQKVRDTIEACDKNSQMMITESFPVMNCKLAAMLLAFHFLKKWNDIEIVCVSGIGENMVSHAWLEINGYVIDITGDQYNEIEDDQLNDDVLQYRPYPRVHVAKASQSYLSHLFRASERIILDSEFSNINEDFVELMENSYCLLHID
ncbi:MAG: hypothetical protein JKY55_15640 [Aliivibrio sp.]|uniref:hypothetical protein n=1 Tax=Aliivibrio sp. TaxID=1872443 RepID=UPI001A3D77C8|nr:hypothetical protein [Aliivibrio sp.]